MKNITRERPHETAYDYYGDPYRLVEFRLFSLNKCEMDCKGCFYNKLNNNYNDYEAMFKLAKSLKEEGYILESIFLLPTEFFENDKNYDLFLNEDFVSTIRLFNFVGVAATLENDFDYKFYKVLKSHSPNSRIELQVNLLIRELFKETYLRNISKRIIGLKTRLGDDIVINLAINAGFNITEEELKAIEDLIDGLSEDGIVEINFTFLFNDKITYSKKRQMLRKAFDQVSHFKDIYVKNTSTNEFNYNERSLLRKPSFSFVGNPNRIFLNPILPFDEYVFIESDSYLLREPTFHGFLTTLMETESHNDPIDEACVECESLEMCLSKGYMRIANHFKLGCYEKKDFNVKIEGSFDRGRDNFKEIFFK